MIVFNMIVQHRMNDGLCVEGLPRRSGFQNRASRSPTM